VTGSDCARSCRTSSTTRSSIPRPAVDDQKLIVEKVGRSNVAGTAKPGTGLGLFIARSIAEAHGGSLEVDSVPNRGSVFRLELPVARD
jgi:signal transduction histidine kinase